MVTAIFGQASDDNDTRHHLLLMFATMVLEDVIPIRNKPTHVSSPPHQSCSKAVNKLKW